MAIMLPEKPKHFAPQSREDEMFESLRKLPDDYFVFHSFRIIQTSNNVVRENEIDFLVFNREKGILCIEAKTGRVRYKNGSWIYSSGLPMKYNSPYTKASCDKHDLIRRINDYKKSRIDFVGKCKFLHAAWFPDYDHADFLKSALPPEADIKLTLTSEAMHDPQTYIDKILNLSVDSQSNLQTTLTEQEAQILVEQILCPVYDIAPLDATSRKITERKMARLLDEQISVLNFLDEQKSVAINGGAGTGKTFIAVEKAHRLSLTGANVLFLCFNTKLKDWLVKTYNYAGVDYYNIDGYAYKTCGALDYVRLNAVLESKFFDRSFEYDYVIVDEGQDFGRSGDEEIEESGVLLTLKLIMDESGGAFYIFYDRLQLVQGDVLPKVISECDCKITLYKNCRNTKSIGKTSVSLLSKEIDSRSKNKFKLMNFWENAVDGTAPNITISNNVTVEEKERLLREALDKYIDEDFKQSEIVILTCKTLDKSFLVSKVSNEIYQYNCRQFHFTTCRKFKGLEAAVVILVDVDKSIILENLRETKCIFYVGTSRARHNLEIFSDLSEDDCREIALERAEDSKKKPAKVIANLLSACLV